MDTNLPNIGRPYAFISPTIVPDYQSLVSKVLETIPKQLPAAPDIQGLLQQAMSAVPKSMPSFQDVLTQGMSSPLLQSVLLPALQNLLPGEELARQTLMDEFRSAGALGGGAMGVASSRLENALQGQRGNLISQIISSILPSIVSGYGQQSQNTLATSGQLINAILGSMGPMTNIYGTETKTAFEPASLMAEVLRQVKPEMVSGVSGGGTQEGFRGGEGGGMMSANRSAPQGPEVNSYSLRQVPYNPYNTFDFRGGSAGWVGPNAPSTQKYNPDSPFPGGGLAQYTLPGGGATPQSIYQVGNSYSTAPTYDPTTNLADPASFGLFDLLNRMAPGGGID